MRCIRCGRNIRKAFFTTLEGITAVFCSRHFSGEVYADFETEKDA